MCVYLFNFYCPFTVCVEIRRCQTEAGDDDIKWLSLTRGHHYYISQSSTDDCISVCQPQSLANDHSSVTLVSLNGPSLSDSAHTSVSRPINDDNSSLSTAFSWINTSWAKKCEDLNSTWFGNTETDKHTHTDRQSDTEVHGVVTSSFSAIHILCQLLLARPGDSRQDVVYGHLCLFVCLFVCVFVCVCYFVCHPSNITDGENGNSWRHETFRTVDLDHVIQLARWQHPAVGRRATFALPRSTCFINRLHWNTNKLCRS